ncbi:hypothetical protein [Umezawaea beigongshangensis]|uniref:hypothetical protein n=1 Tax=Umezawaea beigongshangensis TaxID=2780383 RepID=UPI0018F1FF63|nr:hypothetical protein [Umezawaea beigongshangensis]
MSQRNTVIRSLHDLGLSAWFGGSLMGVVGLNAAADAVGDERRTAQIAGTGWNKWGPVNAVAMTAHLVGATALTVLHRDRILHQQGMGSSSVAKGLLTGAAVAATVYARVLGAQAQQDRPDTGTTAPLPSDTGTTAPLPGDTDTTAPVPGDPESARRKLQLVQWSVPVLTGALQVLSSLHGELQRHEEQRRGFRVRGFSPSRAN